MAEAKLTTFHAPCRPYILPDGYTCPLAPGALAGDLPKGILIVTLVEATDVPAMDWFSASDVFVQCAAGNAGSRLRHASHVWYIMALTAHRKIICDASTLPLICSAYGPS